MRWRLGLSTIFILCSLIISQWPQSWQPFLVLVYQQNFYPFLQSVLQTVQSPNQFLWMDVAWLVAPVLFLIRLFFAFRSNLVRRIPKLAAITLTWLSGLYLVYLVMWGANYQLPTLAQWLNEQGFTRNLTDGHWQFALEETARALDNLPEGVDLCSGENWTIDTGRPAAYALSALALANQPYSPPRDVGFSAWSPVYTRLSVAGVYLPFTGEPSVSRLNFPIGQPFVMTHEYAHWAGYAQEYDADIIAYWALWLGPDPHWQYSGWLEWWRSIRAPQSELEKLPQVFRDSLRCYRDYVRSQPRWQIRRFAWQLYETNLKAQGVSEGLASYRMGEALALSSYQDWLYKKRQR